MAEAGEPPLAPPLAPANPLLAPPLAPANPLLAPNEALRRMHEIQYPGPPPMGMEPYDLDDATDYYILTQEEEATLAGLEGRKSERADEEKTIRDAAESALKSLRSMVHVMFVMTLGAIALGVFRSKRVPAWVIAVATILSMVGFAGSILVAICIARTRLESLRWSVMMLKVRNKELFQDITAFVLGLTARKIYLSVSDYQKTTNCHRHVQGTDFFLKEEPSIRVRSIIALSSPSHDLIQCYRATLWFYGATALAVLIGGIMGVLLAGTFKASGSDGSDA